MTQPLLVALPMKAFDQAKSRLAPAMAPAQRQRLSRALFERTLAFFDHCFPGMDRLVVTPSPQVREAALARCASVALEPSAQGLDAAAQHAIEYAAVHGYRQLLIIPGDIPVWLRTEVQALLALGERREVVIARSRDGGTNALLLRLPTRFRCAYGEDSAQRHAHAARGAGLSVAVCQPPFMAHDIDRPQDCLLHRTRTRSQVPGSPP